MKGKLIWSVSWWMVIALLLVAVSCISGTSGPTVHGIPNFYMVTNGVWRGAEPSDPLSWAYLSHLGVTKVVKLNTTGESADDQARVLGMTVVECPITEGEQLDPLFGQQRLHEQVRKAVDAIGPGTFIHCGSDARSKPDSTAAKDGTQGGQDRTGLVVALYRLKCGWSKEAAEREMIDHGFHKELLGLWVYWKRVHVGGMLGAWTYASNEIVVGDLAFEIDKDDAPYHGKEGITNLPPDASREYLRTNILFEFYSKETKIVTNLTDVPCDFAGSEATGDPWWGPPLGTYTIPAINYVQPRRGINPQGRFITSNVVEVTTVTLKVEGQMVVVATNRTLSANSWHLRKKVIESWDADTNAPNFQVPDQWGNTYPIVNVVMTNGGEALFLSTNSFAWTNTWTLTNPPAQR